MNPSRTCCVFLPALSFALGTAGCASAIQVPQRDERALVEAAWAEAASSAAKQHPMPAAVDPRTYDSVLEDEKVLRQREATAEAALLQKLAALRKSPSLRPGAYLHPDYRSGYHFCQNVAFLADRHPHTLYAFGIPMIVGGSVFAAAAAVIPGKTQKDADDGASRWERIGWGAAAGAGLVVAGVGYYLVSRGSANAQAAEKARAALADPKLAADEDRFAKCLQVRSEWGVAADAAITTPKAR